ncbi:MAG: hypothetical protein DRN53_07635 [Thermoprotei archaeon]|nr:MAG: hypothetical protein DRN53_07635 [Thermoprotei archaeon]
MLADTVVLAMEAKCKTSSIKGGCRPLRHGISCCTECDGEFFRSLDVVIVESESATAYAALFLSFQLSFDCSP